MSLTRAAHTRCTSLKRHQLSAVLMGWLMLAALAFAAGDAPDSFQFVLRSNVPTASFITSELRSIAGHTQAITVSAGGNGNPQFSIDNGAFTNSPVSLPAGESHRIAVRHVSADALETTTVSTIQAGSFVTEFRSVTTADDRVPDDFGFGNLGNVAADTDIESPSIVLAGYTAPAAITPGPGVQYRIGRGEYTSKAGSLPVGATLTVRHRSNAKRLGYTKSFVRVGGVAGNFITRTLGTIGPAAVNDVFSVNQDRVLNVSAPGLLANDTTAKPLTAQLATPAAHGSVVLSPDGAFVYTPAADFFGSDSFTYTNSDGSLRSAAATVSITVKPVGCSASHRFNPPAIERTAVTHFGRRVTPLGHLTDVGNFPGGGALTPDGRFYWAVDEGRGVNDVWIVSVADGSLVQKLPLPGSGGHAVFSSDGSTAYVSGNPEGGSRHATGTPVMATAGNAIHVFSVNTATGTATEQAPISLPSSANQAMGVGSSRTNHSLVAGGGVAYGISEWPAHIAITPDGKTLLVALLNSDRAAIIDTATRAVTVLTVGAYPRGAAIERSGRFGYIANANDGTISKVNLAAKTVAATLRPTLLAEDISTEESHVMGLLADPVADRLYAPLANRDLILVLDTTTDQFTQRIDLRREGGKAGIGVSPVGLAESPDGCTLFVANANENSLTAIALKKRYDSTIAPFSVIGSIPVADYPTAAAVPADGRRLVWVSAKGMGINKGANGNLPVRNKQAWQLGIVGTLDLPDDRYFADMSQVVTANLSPDNQPVPAATVVHGAQSGPFSFAPSSQIKYVFLVVKENRTYDNIFGSLSRTGDTNGAKYQLWEDNCGAANTAFEGASRTHPGCGVTPNAHALVRRWPLLTQFYANSEQSQEGHIYSTGGWLTDYLERNSHWNPSGRGRPYDIGLYPVSYPPKYFIFDQLLRAGISYRNYGEKSGGANPETASQGANRTKAEFTQSQANISQNYPFNGLAACMTATAQSDPAPLFAGCIYDSSARTQTRATGTNVPPPGAVSRFQVFENEFTPMVAAGQWPKFAYLIQFNDHGSGNTPNNITEAAEAADNDLALGQLVDLVSHSSIWGQSAIFVMEDDSQDGSDHIDSHRMPGYVISPWVTQGTSRANAPVITRRYDQLSMLRTIQLILGLPSPALQHALATPMYDAFIAPTATPNLTSYTAVLPERSLIEQNGKTATSIALAKNAPALVKLSQALPWSDTDAVPQSLADRIHYANVWGDDKHYPGAGPNSSPIEAARAEAAIEAYQRNRKNPAKAKAAVRDALNLIGSDDD